MSGLEWVLIFAAQGVATFLVSMLLTVAVLRFRRGKRAVYRGPRDLPGYLDEYDFSALKYPECLKHSDEELSRVWRAAIEQSRRPYPHRKPA